MHFIFLDGEVQQRKVTFEILHLSIWAYLATPKLTKIYNGPIGVVLGEFPG